MTGVTGVTLKRSTKQPVRTLKYFLFAGCEEINCERREHPSQSYGTLKKRNEILNIGRKTILYRPFFYSFSILN